MLTREEYVAICEKCTNRKPSMQGLLCKLTDEKANFQETCPNFELDQQEAANLKKQRYEAEYGDYGQSISGEESSGGINSGIAGGILSIVGSIVWFFGALIYADRIFFYPPILFVIGIISLVRGIQARNEKKRQLNRNSNVLDSDLDDII